MGADLFESYVVILVATLILANTAFGAAKGQIGLTFSLIVPAIGILASIIGIFVVRATPKDRTAMAPINRGLLTSAVLTIIGTFFVAQFYVHNLKVFWAVAHRRGPGSGGEPHHRVLHLDRDGTGPGASPQSARTGPATTVLSGISTGLESAVPGHHRHRDRHRGGHRASATATSSWSCTWCPWSAWACCPTPASWCPRTPSGRCRTTPPASPR